MSRMMCEMIRFEKGFEGYYGATAYLLYPSQSMLEDLRGTKRRDWLSVLAKFLTVLISSSSCRLKIATLTERLTSPDMRCGEEKKSMMYLYWARILDSLAICPTRAYFEAKRFRGASLPLVDVEDALAEQGMLAKRLKHQLNQLQSDNIVVLEKALHIYGPRGGRISSGKPLVAEFRVEGKTLVLRGVPDIYLLVGSRQGNHYRIYAIVGEFAETGAHEFLAYRYLVPRITFYAATVSTCYGVKVAAIYAPLKPPKDYLGESVSEPWAILLAYEEPIEATKRLVEDVRKLARILDETAPPKPQRQPRFCNVCQYRSVCPYKE